jgi:hypothetical protein
MNFWALALGLGFLVKVVMHVFQPFDCFSSTFEGSLHVSFIVIRPRA